MSSLWVIRELESTPEPKRSECIELLSDLRLLQSAPEIDSLVECYIENKVMPADADGDARHLAVATFWKCDVLASWNCIPSFALRVVLRTSYLASPGCKHIANAHKADHIRRVNAKLGYETPTLTTPLELLGEEP